jgi:hypothetical protein
VGVQRMDQRRSFLDDPNPGVAVAVDPTLRPLGQPEPTLQIPGVLHIVRDVSAGEEAGPEAPHHAGHRLADRVLVSSEALEDRVEVGLTPMGSARLGDVTAAEKT